jgi:hypothetical protein
MGGSVMIFMKCFLSELLDPSASHHRRDIEWWPVSSWQEAARVLSGWVGVWCSAGGVVLWNVFYFFPDVYLTQQIAPDMNVLLK